jgi:hypothetical protein
MALSEEIFVCDELRINVARIMATLEEAGEKIAYFGNATDGFTYLCELFSGGLFPKLMIVDMALLPGFDEEIFPDDEVDEGHVTGIVLIEKALVEAESALKVERALLARRVVLYTRVSEELYVSKARAFAQRTGVAFRKKRIEDDGEILGVVNELLSG